MPELGHGGALLGGGSRPDNMDFDAGMFSGAFSDDIPPLTLEEDQLLRSLGERIENEGPESIDERLLLSSAATAGSAQRKQQLTRVAFSTGDLEALAAYQAEARIASTSERLSSVSEADEAPSTSVPQAVQAVMPAQQVAYVPAQMVHQGKDGVQAAQMMPHVLNGGGQQFVLVPTYPGTQYATITQQQQQQHHAGPSQAAMPVQQQQQQQQQRRRRRRDGDRSQADDSADLQTSPQQSMVPHIYLIPSPSGPPQMVALQPGSTAGTAPTPVIMQSMGRGQVAGSSQAMDLTSSAAVSHGTHHGGSQRSERPSTNGVLQQGRPATVKFDLAGVSNSGKDEAESTGKVSLMRRTQSTGDLASAALVQDPAYRNGELSGIDEVSVTQAGLGGLGGFRIGKYTMEERRSRIMRYREKRNHRNFDKKIKYACRKTLADSRPRVRGRFAKNDEVAEMQAVAATPGVLDDKDSNTLDVFINDGFVSEPAHTTASV